MSDIYIKMQEVDKAFHGFLASQNITFGIEKGHIAALLGPSGSGKTTILRMIAGLTQPDCGQVCIAGKCINHVPADKRDIGFVFQNYSLFRHMNIFDNVAFGLKVKKKKKVEINRRVTELLELVGLSNLRECYPYQLSGGQRQRVAFARAVATNPQVLLLDEPFAAIDRQIRKELRVWLRDMIKKLGITSIFVTHDQEEAMELADDIIVINQGKIEQIGTPFQLYTNPKSVFVANFIGDAMKFEPEEWLAGFAFDKQVEQVLIRTENVYVFRMDEKPELKYYNIGIINSVSYYGSYSELYISCQGKSIIARQAGSAEQLCVGEEVKVHIRELFVCFKNDIEKMVNREDV